MSSKGAELMEVWHRLTPALSALLVFAITAWRLEFEEYSETSAASALQWAVALAAGLVILVQRRAPEAALVGGYLVEIVNVFATLPQFGTHVMVGLVTCTIFTRRPPARALTWALPALALLLTAVYIDNPDFGPEFQGTFAVSALAAGLGLAFRAQLTNAAMLRERIVNAEREREWEASRRVALDRLRTARDLHDAVAHQMAVISMNSGLAKRAIGARPDDALAAIEVISTASNAVLSEIAELLEDLRNNDDRMIAVRGIRHISDVVQSRRETGMTVDYRLRGEATLIHPEVSAVAYRVVQEGLTNAYKYGSPSPVQVDVDLLDESVAVRITNHSKRATTGSGGHGLTGLDELVREVGGTLHTTFARSEFVLTATLPAGGAQ